MNAKYNLLQHSDRFAYVGNYEQSDKFQYIGQFKNAKDL